MFLYHASFTPDTFYSATIAKPPDSKIIAGFSRACLTELKIISTVGSNSLLIILGS
ncbi:MAG: hypothetical protein ACI8VT_000187 [Saprospiraceae bacterium]